MRTTYLSLLCLTLSLTLLVGPAAAWNGKGGLPNGFRWSMSGSNVQMKDASGNVIATFVAGSSGGIQTPRVAVGPNGSALPTYSGCVWKYPTWTDGNVIADKTTGSGSATGDDYAIYWAANNNWAANGALMAPAVSCTEVCATSGIFSTFGAPAIFPAGIALPGSAPPSPPTTGIIAWVDLTSGSPALALLGASGKNPQLNVPGNLLAAFYYGLSGSSLKAPSGLETNSGYGIGIGTTAPTFNGLAIKKGTDPLVGIVDCNVIFTRSADEYLCTTDEDGTLTVLAP